MSIEQYDLDQREKARAAAGPKEPEGPTFKEIMASKEQSVLFAERLRLENDTDALDRYTKGKFDADDTKELERQVKEFNELMAEADKLAKTLNSSDLEALIESSPDLKRIHGLNKEGIRAVVGRYLPDLAVRDNDNFRRIADAMVGRERTRERGADYDKAIEEFSKAHGLNEAQYREVIQPGREEALRAMVRGELSWWRQFREGSQATQDAIARRIAELPDKAAIDAYVADLEADRKRIGDALALTLVDNDEMREAFARETLGLGVEKNEVEKEDMSFPELKRALKMSKEDLQKQRKEWWDGLSDQRRTDFVKVGGMDSQEATDDFKRYLPQRLTKGKKGFFKSIFESALFPNVLERLMKA